MPRHYYIARSAEKPGLVGGAHRAQYVIPHGIDENPFGVDVFGWECS
jgi:hypothetical protein